MDSSISTIGRSSGCWETVGWLCAIAVGFGIAGEIVVIVSEHREELDDWRRCIICPTDGPPAWRFWFAIVATLVVLGGVFGEAGAANKVASINSQLRSKTHELSAKSEQLFAVITEEARSAAQSAQDAENSAKAAGDQAKRAKYEADAANTKSGNAVRASSKASDKANEVSRDLDSEKHDLADVETKRKEVETALNNLAVCTAPRILPYAQWGPAPEWKTTVDPLKKFSGRPAFIEFEPNDAETKRAASYIFKVLHDAGWTVFPPKPVDGIPDGVGVQPYIHAPGSGDAELDAQKQSYDALNAILEFLHSFNWQADFSWPLDANGKMIVGRPDIVPPTGVRIRVGLYPPTEYVTPPGAAEVAEILKQARKKTAIPTNNPCQPLTPLLQ